MSEKVKVATYYVWLVAPEDDFAEALTARLIRRGFTIGPLGRILVTKNDDCPASVIAFSAYRVPRNDEERKEYTATGVYHEVTDVAKLLKAKFSGIIVGGSTECTWNVGNISLKEEEAERAEALKKVN